MPVLCVRELVKNPVADRIHLRISRAHCSHCPKLTCLWHQGSVLTRVKVPVFKKDNALSRR